MQLQFGMLPEQKWNSEFWQPDNSKKLKYTVIAVIENKSLNLFVHMYVRVPMWSENNFYVNFVISYCGSKTAKWSSSRQAGRQAGRPERMRGIISYLIHDGLIPSGKWRRQQNARQSRLLHGQVLVPVVMSMQQPPPPPPAAACYWCFLSLDWV